MAKKWNRERLKLQKDHEWTAKPGYKIFVADRGALRFDFPQDWVMGRGEDAIKFHDKQPPDDDCVLQVTIFYLAQGIDWSLFPLPQLLDQATGEEGDGLIERGAVQHVRRTDLEYAWRESRYLDEDEQREFRSRTALARGANVQPLMTLNYWVDDADRFLPVWEEVMGTLRLGEYVEDPTRGTRGKNYG